jgi:hypothetical protein
MMNEDLKLLGIPPHRRDLPVMVHPAELARSPAGATEPALFRGENEVLQYLAGR